MLRKVKWVRAPLGIFGLDVATTKEIMDGEGSIHWLTSGNNRIQLWFAIQWNFDYVSKSILPISGFHLEWQLLLKVKQVGTPPLREGEEGKPFRKESSLQHRGAQGAPGGSDETSKLIWEGKMQPSPELRRDWEFYPGRKKEKIQVMLNPDQLNIALIRIQDK